MKKKLNLLWNLKFNFFSVAERPLTFFAYFLNAKKVGRRRLVISPAKAGAFLFSHTRLPFPPRPLLPFGRILPAAKPRVRSSAPPFGFAAQNRARHFAAHSLGGRPLRGHGFATPHRYFAVPVTAAPRRGPNGKTPALAPVRSHFASGETARPVVAPGGGNVLATPFSLRSNVAPRSHPGAACPVYRTENALFCSCRVFQYLTMQVKAPFY